jgi:hypothetical protein
MLAVYVKALRADRWAITTRWVGALYSRGQIGKRWKSSAETVRFFWTVFPAVIAAIIAAATWIDSWWRFWLLLVRMSGSATAVIGSITDRVFSGTPKNSTDMVVQNALSKNKESTLPQKQQLGRKKTQRGRQRRTRSTGDAHHAIMPLFVVIKRNVSQSTPPPLLIIVSPPRQPQQNRPQKYILLRRQTQSRVTSVTMMQRN